MIGRNKASIVENCCVTGLVKGYNLYTGGLIGSSYDNSLVIYCKSNCLIDGFYGVGGLVGNNLGSRIEASYANTIVRGNDNIGGLAGDNSDSIIKNCYTKGTITCLNNTAGGLIGFYSGFESQVKNCYSSCIINADNAERKGGLIGYNNSYESTIANSYWDIETSGMTTSTGGEGRTTAEMTIPHARTTAEMTIPHAGDTFVDWDFSNIWGEDDNYINNGYLILRSATGIMENGEFTIDNYKLEQNYPNPFNPTTEISYALSQDANVSIKVYNSNGSVVADLVNASQSVGHHSVKFDASKLSNGIFYYSLVANGRVVSTKKMLLLK